MESDSQSSGWVMWRSPLPKGILGDPHLAHMIASSVPSSRDLRRSESVRPAKLNTSSAVALAAGIARNWRAMTAMRGKRACPTSLHQTKMSTSWVMSDPSSFLPITALLLDRRHCISSLVLSASDICGDLPPEVDSTVCAGDTIMHNKRQQSDVLQSFSVTSTRGRREAYLLCSRKHGDVSRYSWSRRSQWTVRCGYCRCIFYNRTGSGRTHRWNADTERGEDSTNCRILVPLTDLWRLRLVAREKAGHGDDSRFSWRFPDKGSWGVCSLVWANVFPAFLDLPISPRWFFFVRKFVFFQEFATNTGDVSYTLTSELMFSWMCVPWVGW